MAIGDFITTREAADLLEVSEGRVRQFVVEKRLKARKIGTVLFFKRKEVQQFKRVDRPNGKPRKEADENFSRP